MHRQGSRYGNEQAHDGKIHDGLRKHGADDHDGEPRQQRRHIADGMDKNIAQPLVHSAGDQVFAEQNGACHKNDDAPVHRIYTRLPRHGELECAAVFVPFDRQKEQTASHKQSCGRRCEKRGPHFPVQHFGYGLTKHPKQHRQPHDKHGSMLKRRDRSEFFPLFLNIFAGVAYQAVFAGGKEHIGQKHHRKQHKQTYRHPESGPLRKRNVVVQRRSYDAYHHQIGGSAYGRSGPSKGGTDAGHDA